MKKDNLISRRELLTKGLKAGAVLGLGGLALGSSGDINPFIPNVFAGQPGIFNFTAAEDCVLTCQQTIGPCYYAADLIRSDITEGKVGFPVRLAFRVVNVDTCSPIQNASIDIWHTDNNGIYSAPISTFCNGTDTAVQSQRFGRGIQFTDADGMAYFTTIYPGWYSGRTTHIHATIRINNTSIVTTQFYFADRISEFIYRNHPNYISRPNRNTTNTSDNILGGSLPRMMPYIFNTKFVPNKALLAAKVIGIRTSATSCNA